MHMTHALRIVAALAGISLIVAGCSRPSAPTAPAGFDRDAASPALASSVPTFPGASHFVARIDNPWMPLTPGQVFTYLGEKDGARELNPVHVTHRTKTILGVSCREVLDTVYVNGEVA